MLSLTFKLTNTSPLEKKIFVKIFISRFIRFRNLPHLIIFNKYFIKNAAAIEKQQFINNSDR